MPHFLWIGVSDNITMEFFLENEHMFFICYFDETKDQIHLI